MKAGILVAALLLAGCSDRTTNTPMSAPAPRGPDLGPPPQTRVTVERIGAFRDDLAYNDLRGIYIITDRKTGREYLGISGVGIAEVASHQVGKTRVGDER